MEIGGKIRKNSNNYPRIIDDETWEKCAKKRAANKYEQPRKEKYLLSRLIRCECGSAYSVNVMDGCYNCRVKHNGVEKGLSHSPNIQGNTIDSLAWYVALLELQSDDAIKSKEFQAESKEKIHVLEQKIEVAEEKVKTLVGRRAKLDEDFYVHGRMDEKRYQELTDGQNKNIADERAKISTYKSQISFLSEQITESVNFDEIFNTLKGQYETLKSGTDIETMRTIVRRYIKEITIEPREGKLTSFWKVAKIKLVNAEAREAMIKQYEEQGLHDIAVTLGTTFFIDCHHYIAYWDEESKYPVPMEMLSNIGKKRTENRKNRKRKKTQNPQY